MQVYRAEGSGPVLLLIHGFGFHGGLWEAQIGSLSERYRVLAVHMPGHGGAPPLPGEAEQSMSAFAGAALGLLDREGVRQAAVVGHSMGGYVALALAKAAPERVAGLSLVASQARADTPEGRAGRAALAERARQQGPEAVWQALGPKLFAPSAAADSPLRRQVEEMARAMSVRGIEQSLSAMAGREDLRDWLPSLAVPALFLTGADDVLIPADRTSEMAALVPGSALALVEGAGHAAPMEQPAAVTAALAEWLGKVYS